MAARHEASPRLVGSVIVDDVWYGPDDDVPAKVAAKIGPHAWVDGEHPDAEAFDDYIASLDPAEAGAMPPVKDRADRDGLADGPPPQSGTDSGESQWRAYAERVGFPADELAKLEKRDDIIAALKAAGHPVERSTD